MSSTPQQRVSPPRSPLVGRGRGGGRPTDPGTLGVRGRRARAMYVAVAPYFLLFAVFSAIPIAFTMFLAFTNWRGIGSWDMVGFTNFEYLLHDPLFWKSLKNTLILWVMSTVPCLTLATLVALALNSAVRFSTAFRVAYLVPNITSLVAMGILFSSIFSSNFGIANLLMNSVGLESVRWLQTEWGIKIAIASLTCWSFVGYNALIILAGLQSIEKQVYEAAQIDGAGPVRTFFSITLPMLRPIILFITIMSTIGSLQSFTESQVMTSSQGGGASSAGGVGNSGLTMVLYFYSVAFQENRYGYGATIAWGVMVVVVIFTIINWFATRERKR
ncbi:carbohydrate ABC transporter permease [Brachybacterium alimentarium]|uniref:carbohydrate ABC transporter permease n=1 Tax=Brachybacterium alimentarium TaxID=47845 RepID=UPI0021630654|nr:sugar ABC transporter permease [Brachybacterium alimentarium]